MSLPHRFTWEDLRAERRKKIDLADYLLYYGNLSIERGEDGISERQLWCAFRDAWQAVPTAGCFGVPLKDVVIPQQPLYAGGTPSQDTTPAALPSGQFLRPDTTCICRDQTVVRIDDAIIQNGETIFRGMLAGALLSWRADGKLLLPEGPRGLDIVSILNMNTQRGEAA